jgi:acyl-CoA thioesterase FadM
MPDALKGLGCLPLVDRATGLGERRRDVLPLLLLVLAKAAVRYKSPARYDDMLTLRTTVSRTTPVRIEHKYEVFRDGQLLAEGETTLACVDREGRLQALPDWMQQLK